MNCVFCKIINGDIPSYKIYEDDVVLVFLDVNPTVNGHTLIIPKKHFLDLYEIPNDTLMHIFDVARKIGKMYEEKLGAKGITLVQNNGLGQEVKHYHLHIKPQYEDKQELMDVERVYEQIKG